MVTRSEVAEIAIQPFPLIGAGHRTLESDILTIVALFFQISLYATVQ
jgi:hypothetical protein